MKRKILSILFAMVLVVSFSLVTAAPAGAGTADYTNAVIKAADWLAANQNDDGGFAWKLADSPGASATNCLGITAIGILKAYELEEKAAYETALAKAYKYVVDNPPGWVQDSTDTSKWKEDPKGVDSYPDVTFLISLAEAAARDTSLLGAIQTQVPGTTAASIATLAKERWNGRVNHMGATHPSETGTATAMAEYVRDARHGQNYDALIPWDLEAAVKAALALDAYYPGEGYNTQALSIVTVIYTSVDDAGGTYFNSGDTSQSEYVIGLTGAIEAFVEAGVYPEKVTALKALLINIQQDDGYWNYYEGETPVPMSVQSTAYAVMALLRQSDADAVAAAQKGADWLELSQNPEGGWFSEDGAGDEYLEIDSEAAWAIKVVLDSLSASVGMTAAYTPRVGISVNPTWVDFGAVVPGVASDSRNVSVTNYGNVNVAISASIINESPPGVYTAAHPDGLTIDTSSVGNWGDSVLIGDTTSCPLALTVPSGTAPGSYSATLVFWAEMAE